VTKIKVQQLRRAFSMHTVFGRAKKMFEGEGGKDYRR
jgi:hypothetical protein